MTSLQQRKTRLTFETCDAVRERGKLRAVDVEAQPYFALVRLKGTRTAFSISYAAIYQPAARIKADETRREKKAARAAKKGGAR